MREEKLRLILLNDASNDPWSIKAKCAPGEAAAGAAGSSEGNELASALPHT